MEKRETAIVFGVGPGLGWALAKRFAAENMRVGVVAPQGRCAVAIGKATSDFRHRLTRRE